MLQYRPVKKGYLILTLLMLGFIAYAGYGSMDVQEGSYDDVSPRQAYGMLQEREGAYLLDVRTQGEFENEHIEGAVNIPNERPNALEDDWREVPEDRKVIIYCRTGRRSANAAQFLAEKGYDQVYNVEGGITRWKSEGLPVTR